MLNVTIRQLRAIQAVHACGSFASAARAIHVSAAALSAMIRESEAALGFRIFVRTTRSLSLTEAGAGFLPHAQRVLAELDRAEDFVLRYRETDNATLRIAATQFLACTVLPPLFQAFRTSVPEARMQIIDSSIDDVIETVRSGNADLGIYLEVEPDDVLDTVPMFASRLCVVTAPSHPLAALPEIGWDQLAGQDIIYLGREDQLSRNLAEAGIALDLPHHRVAHGTSALALIAAGEGIAVMTHYVQPMLPIYGLRMIPLVNPTLSRQVVVVYRKTTPLARLSRKFIDFARESRMDV